jgi:3-oxoacyl-[acyl-carrier-protein] synthase-3
LHIGIIGHGTWFPPTVKTAAELGSDWGLPEDVVAQKFGVRQKPVAGAAETTAAMGLEAARTALADAGIEGRDLDLVIWCGAQHKDYPCWLAGLHVAEQLGARGAWSFDMEAMCGSMMAALEVAKSLMLARDDLGTVLLVSGYRNNDLISPANPKTRFMLDIGSGGAALVLRKNAGRNAVLGSAFRGDGSLSEMCVVPTLGSKAWPPAPGDAERARFDVPDEEAFKRKLNEVTLPNFYAVIREALRRSGVAPGEPRGGIDYLAILHFKRSAHEAILAELGLGPEHTSYLEDYGHVGQNDQVLSLELGLAAGKIGPGSRIVMVGAGLGFVWAATVVRWGPCKE